jgi:predicted DNA-binding transcriptional regulator YafY
VWSGPELAEHLGVTTRSVRRDVERLRELGYPVHASTGHGGGYQLGAGAALPPLLVDSDEAVAMAVCLRLAAG